jgi:phosphoribosylformimino-5-aminoimidazole carboxamide ribonucleotide (ProFAR) isomerase
LKGLCFERAYESPEKLESLVRKFGARICVGIDADGVVKPGWEHTTEVSAIEFVCAVKDLGWSVVYTDISRTDA